MQAIRIISKIVAAGLLATSGVAHAQWSVIEGEEKPSKISFLVEQFSEQDWHNSNFADPQRMEEFKDWRYGLMISFGITAKSNTDLSWGIISANERKAPDGNALADGSSLPMAGWTRWDRDVALEKFDARAWVKWAEQSGFKYIVVIAKHHEGFHQWDTAFSDYKITNTPFGRDYLKEVIDACHEAGMPVGIYYSQRDWYHPSYQPVGWGTDRSAPGPDHQKYIDYQFKVVRELLTKYGKIDIFWWDAVWWGGMFKASHWDAERLTRMVRELQPGIIQNNRASVPGDFDSPEQRMGVFQTQRPWEAVVSFEDTWSYSGKNPKTREQVIKLLVKSAINDGNLLLSLGPQWSGEFDPSEMQTTRDVGSWLRNYGTSIFGTRGGPWKPHGWGGSTWRGSKAYLHVLNLDGEQIALPAIDGRAFRKAAVLGLDASGRLKRHALKANVSGGEIRLTIPKSLQNDLDTVVELEFSGSLAGVAPLDPLTGVSGAAASEHLSKPFDYELVYGKRVDTAARLTASSLSRAVDADQLAQLISGQADGDFAISTGEGQGQWIQLDLGKETFVTGVFLDAAANGKPLAISLSSDGEAFTEVWRAGAKDGTGPWEIEVNDFIAGAQTPGRAARYVRVHVVGEAAGNLTARQLGIWTKANK